MTKNDQPLVSVIVPVYRAEKYIRQCVDSLLGQSYRNIEVILVDDGSPDRSGAICDEYAAADSRVKVIHQPNGGVSVARQTGMDNATGDYSIHADPDDWVEPVMIEELVAKALETDADYTFCDYYEEYGDGTSNATHYDISEVSNSLEIVEKELKCEIISTLWRILIKRERVKGISFIEPKLLRCEDTLFLMRAFSRNAKVAYVPKLLYHYRCNNSTSLNNSLSDSHIDSIITYATTITRELQNLNVMREELLDSYKIEFLKRIIKFEKLKYYKQILTLFPEVHRRVIIDCSRYRIMSPVGSCLAIALNGHPRLAWCFFSLNMWFIRLKENIQRKEKYDSNNDGVNNCTSL